MLTFRETSDDTIRFSPPDIQTGRKWKAEEETDAIIANLKHKDIVGSVQTSRAGLGNATFKPFSCMNQKERRKEIVKTARADKERKRHQQLVQFSQQSKLSDCKKKDAMNHLCKDAKTKNGIQLAYPSK